MAIRHGTQLERTVFQRGRTTGHTSGIVNNLPATVNMRYRNYQVVRRVVQVLSPLGSSFWYGDPTRQTCFATADDSGSLVLDYKGKPLGLYIGETPRIGHRQYDPGYIGDEIEILYGLHFITPIEAALKDIKKNVKRWEGVEDVSAKLH